MLIAIATPSPTSETLETKMFINTTFYEEIKSQDSWTSSQVGSVRTYEGWHPGIWQL